MQFSFVALFAVALGLAAAMLPTMASPVSFQGGIFMKPPTPLSQPTAANNAQQAATVSPRIGITLPAVENNQIIAAQVNPAASQPARRDDLYVLHFTIKKNRY